MFSFYNLQYKQNMNVIFDVSVIILNDFLLANFPYVRSLHNKSRGLDVKSMFENYIDYIVSYDTKRN